MLPSISTVLSIEMVRDGGSLAAHFIGANGSSYCLHFQLITMRDSNGDVQRIGYAKPVVFERLEFREANRFEWQGINLVEVSWIHARVLLRQLRGHRCNDRDSKWLAAMEESATAEGALPQAVVSWLHALK